MWKGWILVNQLDQERVKEDLSFHWYHPPLPKTSLIPQSSPLSQPLFLAWYMAMAGRAFDYLLHACIVTNVFVLTLHACKRRDLLMIWQIICWYALQFLQFRKMLDKMKHLVVKIDFFSSKRSGYHDAPSKQNHSQNLIFYLLAMRPNKHNQRNGFSWVQFRLANSKHERLHVSTSFIPQQAPPSNN